MRTRKSDFDNIFKLYVESDSLSTDFKTPGVQNTSGDPGEDYGVDYNRLKDARGDQANIKDMISKDAMPPATMSKITTTQGRMNVGTELLKSTLITRWNYQTSERYGGGNHSLLIYGEPGIGKSETVEDTAKLVAKHEGREFVNVNDLGKHDRSGAKKYPTEEEVVADPSRYFIYMVKPTAGMEASDMEGIPSIKGTEDGFAKLMPLEWQRLMVVEGLAGFIFFDELGHADPKVQQTLLLVIQSRILGRKSLAHDMFIVCATNLPNSPFNRISNELDPALVDRLGVVQLIPDPREWGVWARANNIHPLVIAFVNFRPEETFYIDPNTTPADTMQEIADQRAFPTPRSVAKVGQVITAAMEIFNRKKQITQLHPDAQEELKKMMASGTFKNSTALWDHIYRTAYEECGERWGSLFASYVKHWQDITFDDYLYNPRNIAGANAYQYTALLVHISQAIAETWEKYGKPTEDDAERAYHSGKPMSIIEYDAILVLLANTDDDRRLQALMNSSLYNKEANDFFVAYIDVGHYNEKLKHAWIGPEAHQNKQGARIAGYLGNIMDRNRFSKSNEQ